MNRRLLLRPALVALASALLAFFHGTQAGAARRVRQDADKITQGTLRAFDAAGRPAGECPLRHTAVRAEVSGFISRVTVTQEFGNPFQDKIEAVYVFPLPQAAAVDEMTMHVGGRTVRAKVMRREEAQAAYREARARGHVASLLDQERPNVFTQSVANILPGQSVTVAISYVETLKYESGTYEWSFPMVVGRRYVPAAADAGAQTQAEPATQQESSAGESQSAGVPDAARLNPAFAGEGVRAGHDISVEVAIDAGVPLESVVSTSHAIDVERAGGSTALVRLKASDSVPNRDFVLRYGVAGGRVEDALLTHASARGRFFALILQPPDRVAPAEVVPKELVFVLDTSGSMSGFPIEKAKETMRLALGGLNPQDTFNLITFAGDTAVLFPRPVPATRANLSKAMKFLEGQGGGGGTEMMKAIRAALADSDSQEHVRVVCFMTDGQVGNDFEIISEVQKHPRARVFSMGFGSDPNRFLLDKMAEYGRGEVEYVGNSDPGSEAARRFYERVRDPLLTDISVEWGGLPVADVYPKAAPDLFGAKPVVIFGRYERGGRATVTLKGRAAGRDFAREVAVTLPDSEEGHDVLGTLWARRRVDELTGRDMAGMQSGKPDDRVREEITRLGLDFGLMTQFTSFVAVEEGVVTDGGEPRRVDVPAESPAASPGVVSQSVASAGSPPAANVVGMSSLAPGAAAGVYETVTVVASAPTVNESSCSTSMTVETRAVAELPLEGRRLLSLARVAPGGTAAPGAHGPDGFSFDGQSPRSNTLVVDGVSADPAGPPVAADAAREFTVRAEYFEPEYGRRPGAQVSVVTNAGTNEFRGSLFGYFGHEALDASDWFAGGRGLGRQPQRFADYGGTLGGPVRRDQTFFFAAYERQRRRAPAYAFTEVPSPAARLAAPAALRPFLDAFPVPNGAARADGFAEFAAGYEEPSRLDALNFHLDHNASDRLSLEAHYNVAGSGADTRGAGGSSLNTLSRVRALAQTFTAGASYMLSPEKALELRGGYGRVASRGSRLLDAFGGAAVPGAETPAGALLNLTPTTGQGGSFVFDLGGRGAALAPASVSVDVRRQLNLVGALDAVSGNHTYKLGADYRRLTPSIAPRAFGRDLFFEGVAGALAGRAARDGTFARAGVVRPVFQDLAAYAQDVWRKTRKLTLTYGLRWELSPAPHARGRLEAAAVTRAEDPARLALAAPGSPLWETTYFNFAPRFGVAYQLSNASGRELLLRAGAGLFYDTGFEEAGRAFADSYPFGVGGAAFGVPFTPEGSAPAAPAGAPLSAFDPRLKLPFTLRWNASVVRALGGAQSIEAAYVGSAGRRLLLTRTLLDTAPGFALARVTNNGGASDYHAARLVFTRRMTGGLHASASYTFARSLDDFSEDEPGRALLRSETAGAERAPSDFDVRHTLSGFVSYELPSPFGGGAWRALTRDWALDAVFVARSARPLNVVYGFPTAYGFAFLRPDILPGVPPYLADADAPGGRRLNPEAFALPGAARQGTLGRNALRGFPSYQLDVALRRRFDFSERVRLQMGAEAFDLLNHPNFDDPAGVLALV
ncbi:MAG TPA: VIT domain-containing protein, partial [Pyrinomonadaceae bacterium]